MKNNGFVLMDALIIVLLLICIINIFEVTISIYDNYEIALDKYYASDETYYYLKGLSR